MQAITSSAADIYETPLPDTSNPAFTPSKDGLPVFHGKTFEDHVEAWNHVNESVECRLWALGAIAASLVTKYNDQTVKRFAYEVRLSRSRVYEIADTYRKFEKSERSEILSFHHHTVAAKAKDPAEAIKKAEDNEWSTRQLDHYVETGCEPEPTPKSTKPGWALQSVARRALAAHIELDAVPALLDLKTKCPDPTFAGRFYGNLVRELLEQKKDLETEDAQAALLAAYDLGFKTDIQLADHTKMPVNEARKLMKALAEQGYFTEQDQVWKSDMARGSRSKEWQRTDKALPDELRLGSSPN